jgi:hypothetical protein
LYDSLLLSSYHAIKFRINAAIGFITSNIFSHEGADNAKLKISAASASLQEQNGDSN